MNREYDISVKKVSGYFNTRGGLEMLNNRYINALLRDNTDGPMRVTSVYGSGGIITIFAVRKNSDQARFLRDYLDRFGLTVCFE